MEKKIPTIDSFDDKMKVFYVVGAFNMIKRRWGDWDKIRDTTILSPTEKEQEYLEKVFKEYDHLAFQVNNSIGFDKLREHAYKIDRENPARELFDEEDNFCESIIEFEITFKEIQHLLKNPIAQKGRQAINQPLET